MCCTASDDQNGQQPFVQCCRCQGNVYRPLIGSPETSKRPAKEWQWTVSGRSNGHAAEGPLQQAALIPMEHTKSNTPDACAQAVASVECSAHDRLQLARSCSDFEQAPIERCRCGGDESNGQAFNGALVESCVVRGYAHA